jgi:hypothetical protein
MSIDKLKLNLVKFNFGTGTLFSGSAYMANNWSTYLFWDQYNSPYCQSSFTNMCWFGGYQMILLLKSVYIGCIWPFIVSDFYFYRSKENNYIALKHLIPFTDNHNGKFALGNINISESIDKYGFKKFLWEGRHKK